MSPTEAELRAALFDLLTATQQQPFDQSLMDEAEQVALDALYGEAA